MSYGIDVSKYQSTKAPGGVPWSLLAPTCRFVIVRATYGTYRDPSAVAHVQAARTVGMQVGLYAFFRVGQPVADQLAAFCAQAFACGIKVGDICPALDIEGDPKVAAVSPEWSDYAQAMSDGLVAAFGDCLCYITQRDFGRMGKPAWVLERPSWVAHYTSAPKPATPGNKPATIWQKRVGPYQANGPGGVFAPMVLDQNVALGPLPLGTRVPGASGSDPVGPDGPEPAHTFEALQDCRLATTAVALGAAAYPVDSDSGHSGRDVANQDPDSTPQINPRPNS